ncbi:MAG: methyltransferase domain-containing protein [bacterium]|nr:methyltransferase domain-containing protein [bacterium]
MNRQRYSFDDHLFTPGTRQLLRHALPGAGEHVLDLAAGSGIAARLCAEAVGPEGSVTALDIGANILKKAQSLYAGPAPGSWVRGDAVALPFADASFDLVVCHQGLQFFPDRTAAVGHLERVLRPGGRAAIMTWAALDDCPFYRALHQAVARHLGEPAAGFVRQPFSLPDVTMLRELYEPVFEMVTITGIAVDTVHPSPGAFARGFLRYLPPALAAAADVAAAASPIARDVTDELVPWCVGDELHAPITAHVVLCSRG